MGDGRLISAAIGVGAWLIAAALSILGAPEVLGWVFAVLGAGFLITAFLWWGHGSLQAPRATQSDATSSAAPTPHATQNPDQATTEERVFIDVTPAYLVGLFKDQTDLQAMKLTPPYLGKWMKVSGPLGNVLSGRQTISQVTFEKKSPFDPDYEAFDVYMYFDRERWDDQLAVLRLGTNITVVGRLREFDRVTVHLEDCELVRPQAAPPALD